MKKISALAALGLLVGSGLTAQNFRVSGGTRYSVALTANGGVLTWGDNSRGQLARKTTKNATVLMSDGDSKIAYDDVPTPMVLKDAKGDAFSVIAVDAGSGGHAIAIGSDSTVWTWGGNEHGQLGNGIANYGVHSAQCTDLTSVDWIGNEVSICNKGVPQHVVAGETAGKTGFEGVSGFPYTGRLKNVISISASASGSFAIVKDPVTKKTNLLAWGSNKNYANYCDATGQLGVGSSTLEGSSYPRYVLDKNGNPLTNVIAVDAGDNNCFAIVDDDNDGDATTGTVYGWGDGTNNKLSPTTTFNQLSAMPVYIDAAGTIALTGVVKIAAGDGFMLASDKNGKLWSVGNEWCASASALSTRANGMAAYTNPKEAAKVVAGDLSSYNGGGKYLDNVKDIAAGQASGIAMVEATIAGKKSNYIMGWGSAYGSEDRAASGVCVNQLGNKTNTGSLLPGFAYRTNWRTGDIELMDSVVSVSDGDGMTYAVRDEKNESGQTVAQLYVTGTNGAGQLGFDPTNVKGTCVFTRLSLSGTTVALPCPIPHLKPISLKPTQSEKLFAGVEKLGDYHFVWKWYDSTGANTKDGLPGWVEDYEKSESNTFAPDKANWKFDTGFGDAARIIVQSAGYWKVTVYDTRSGAISCPIVSDSVIVTWAKPTFDTTAASGCGAKTLPYIFKVTKEEYLQANAEKKFLVYGSESASTPLATITQADFEGSNATISALNLSDLQKLNDTTYRMWVADSTIIHYDILSSTKAPVTPLVTKDLSVRTTAPGLSSYMEVFTAYKNIVLKSVTINLQSTNATGSVVVTPVVYKAISTSYGYKPGEEVYRGSGQTVAITRTESPYVITVGTPVAGQLEDGIVYILGIGVTGTDFTATGAQVTIPVAGVLDATGSILKINAAPKQQTDGTLMMPDKYTSPLSASVPYNWAFDVSTDYQYGRVPVSVRNNCTPAVPKISFSNKQVSMLEKKKLALAQQLSQSNVFKVLYKVENTAVASVEETGVVSGIAEGKTKVIAYSSTNTNVSDTLELTVLSNAVNFTAENYAIDNESNLDLLSYVIKNQLVTAKFEIADRPIASSTINGGNLLCIQNDVVKVYVTNTEDATRKDSALFTITLNNLVSAQILDYDVVTVSFLNGLTLYNGVENDFTITLGDGSSIAVSEVTKQGDVIKLKLTTPIANTNNVTVSYKQTLKTGSRTRIVFAQPMIMKFYIKAFTLYETDSIDVMSSIKRSDNIHFTLSSSNNSSMMVDQNGLVIAKQAGVEYVSITNTTDVNRKDSAKVTILPVIKIVGLKITGSGTQVELSVDRDYTMYSGIEKDFNLSVDDQLKSGDSYTVLSVMKSAEDSKKLLLQLDKSLLGHKSLTVNFAPISTIGTYKVRSSFTVDMLTDIDSKATSDAAIVYPNPAYESVSVIASNLVQIAIYNDLGALVKMQPAQGNEAVVSLANLAEGMYVVEVITAEKTIKKTIIKR